MTTNNQERLDYNYKAIWKNCAIGFYLQGVEEKLEGDIYYPPGKYAFNMHTMLDFESMTHINDVWYVMTPDERHYTTGTNTLGYPSIWLDCPKGITVRKLPKEHENGGERPHFENRNEFVFICSVPNEIWIHGEEFVWRN